MSRLRIIPLDDAVAFPGMPVTLTVDVGPDASVLLVPRQGDDYAKVGVVADSEDVRAWALRLRQLLPSSGIQCRELPVLDGSSR
jgi:hypothetical protein